MGVTHLTQPLSERTPMIQLPPPFANTPSWKTHEISRYDDKGPAWYWNWFEGSEHAGTHFDAPIHWVTGKDKDDVSQVPVERLIGPAVVIDKSREAQANPDYLLRWKTSWHSKSNMGRCPRVPGSCIGPDGTREPSTRRSS